MSPTWWVIAGVVLLVAELAHTAFIMCWLAAAAFVVAGAAGLGVASIEGQLILFGAVSVTLVLASRTILKPLLPRARGAATNVDALAGAVGTVDQAIGFLPGEGRVALQGLDWAARSHDERPIAKGMRVRVVSVEGVTLVVVPETDLGGQS